jgi:hypothetical protein
MLLIVLAFAVALVAVVLYNVRAARQEAVAARCAAVARPEPELP